MKIKIIVSVLTTLMVGLMLIPDAVIHMNGSLPFMIGASVVCGLAIYFILGYFEQIISKQSESLKEAQENAKLLQTEIKAVKDNLTLCFKGNEETLLKLSTQHLQSLNEMSKDITNCFKEIGNNLVITINDVEARSEQRQKEFNETFTSTFANVCERLDKQTENLYAQLTEISGKQEIGIKEITTLNNATNKNLKSLGEKISNSTQEIENRILTAIEKSTLRFVEEQKNFAETLRSSSERIFEFLAKQTDEFSSQLKEIQGKYENQINEISNLNISVNHSIDLLAEKISDTSRNLENKLATTIEETSSKIAEEGSMSLNRIHDILLSTQNSTLSISESLEKHFDKLIGLNAKYEESLKTIDSSIGKFFGNNKSVQQDLITTAREIKALQDHLTQSVREQDKIVGNILNSALSELKDLTTSTLSNMDKNNSNLKNDIEGIVEMLKSTTDKTISSISEVMNSQRELTDSTIHSTINELKRISRDSNNRIEDNSKDLKDSLQELFEEQNESIQDVTNQLKEIGLRIDENISTVKDTTNTFSREMSRISATIPQLKELSKSEEILMKELERICSKRR